MIKKFFTADKLSLVLLIVMLGIIIFFSHNRYLAIGEARKMLELEQQALTAEQLQLRQAQELEQEGPLFQQRLELFEKLIPEKITQFDVELYIHAIAYRNNIAHFEIRFASEESFDEYMELPLHLHLEGSYHEILNFMQTLRQGERVFRVDSMDLYPTNSATGKLHGNIQLSTFYRN